MKWNIDDVPVFVAVVEQNGISAAARTLDMPKSTVSTAVGRLENAIGLRLFDRNTRNLRITAEGETFYRQALLIMEQVRETDAAMADLSATPSGRLTVAVPPAFCQELIAPNFATFKTSYPHVDLDFLITSHGVDLVRDQVDMAIVVGPQEDSDLISRTLISSRLVWVTTQDYLALGDIGETPEQILPHLQLCEKRYGLKRAPVHLHGEATHIDLSRGITHVNNPLVVRSAVLNGAGLSLLPLHYCRDQLREGSLIEVCQHITFDLEASKLTVVFPSNRLMSPKNRAFLKFLDKICSA